MLENIITKIKSFFKGFFTKEEPKKEEIKEEVKEETPVKKEEIVNNTNCDAPKEKKVKKAKKAKRTKKANIRKHNECKNREAKVNRSHKNFRR